MIAKNEIIDNLNKHINKSFNRSELLRRQQVDAIRNQMDTEAADLEKIMQLEEGFRESIMMTLGVIMCNE